MESGDKINPTGRPRDVIIGFSWSRLKVGSFEKRSRKKSIRSYFEPRCAPTPPFFLSFSFLPPSTRYPPLYSCLFARCFQMDNRMNRRRNNVISCPLRNELYRRFWCPFFQACLRRIGGKLQRGSTRMVEEVSVNEQLPLS